MMTYEYTDYQGLVFSLARSFYRTTGFDMDELIGLGTEVFCKSLKHFDEAAQIKFSTFLYRNLTNCFRTAVARPQITVVYPSTPSEDGSDFLDTFTDSYDVQRQLEFRESLLAMSPMAQEIVSEILSDPISFGLGSGMRQKRLRGVVVARLKEKGLYKNQAYDVVKEIKEVVDYVY